MDSSIKISFVKTVNDLEKCFPVMVQLRNTLSMPEFIKKVKAQQNDGYKLVSVEDKDQVVALAGVRILESLSWGKFLYVDDLITDDKNRSKGYGDKLFDFLTEYGKKQGCKEFHLDSGVQRFDAHRFYLRKRMEITCHHFAIRLQDK